MRDVVRHLIEPWRQGRERSFARWWRRADRRRRRPAPSWSSTRTAARSARSAAAASRTRSSSTPSASSASTGADLHSFVLDHDYAWADGLICGGKMVIATEALAGPEALAYYRRLHRLIEAGEGFTEAVVVNPERVEEAAPGRRFLFEPDGRPLASLARGDRPRGLLARPVSPLCGSAQAARCRRAWPGLPSLPRIRLVIVGAGHVGQAVAELAAEADFDVWVVDDRGQYATPSGFPTAQRFVVGPIEEVLSSLEVTRNTFVLIVTRGHGHDQEALFHLAPTPASYVGLIGSRRKIKMIFESLREMGIAEADLARVTAPVGLDIGSQTVPEIAISIVAELIARRNLGPGRLPSRTPAASHDMSPTIHPRHRPGRRQEPADGTAQAAPASSTAMPLIVPRRAALLETAAPSRSRRRAPAPTWPEGPLIADAAAQAGAMVVAPETRPLEMRDSIDLAIAWLQNGSPPRRGSRHSGRHPGAHARDRPQGARVLGRASRRDRRSRRRPKTGSSARASLGPGPVQPFPRDSSGNQRDHR